MSEGINPYAPPRVIDAALAPPIIQPQQGIWRSGKVLVMAKEAQLPPVCVKGNHGANRMIKRSLQWHHPAIALMILLGLLPYLVLALVMMKRATIHVGMCNECMSRRRRAIAIGWGLGLMSVALFIGGLVLVTDKNMEAVGGFTVLAGVLLFIGTVVYAIVATGLVKPSRISDRFVWLKGVHPDVLDKFPVWPNYE